MYVGLICISLTGSNGLLENPSINFSQFRINTKSGVLIAISKI